MTHGERLIADARHRAFLSREKALIEAADAAILTAAEQVLFEAKVLSRRLQSSLFWMAWDTPSGQRAQAAWVALHG